MSRYIDAEQLEKAGWVMHRTTQESPTSITYETRKPTDFPTDWDVQEVRWIPVTERLPEERGIYLVSGKWANEDSEVWLCEFVRLYNWGWCNAADRPVVQAWMPLPEPYKEGEQNG